MAFSVLRQVWHLMYSAVGTILRHPIAGTSIVPVMPDGRIVLIRRRDTDKWALPGGVIDWGEEIRTTVQRELLEETGLELVNIRRLVGVYSKPLRDPRFHSVCVMVEADVDGTFNVQDTIEITDIKAFQQEDIPVEELSHDHSKQIKDYFSGETVLA
ncbi:MAG: NUDIX domain-containing protein [Cyanobacteria bacterium P01_F01_bin.150]